MELRHTKTNSASLGMQKDADQQLLKDGQYINAINSRLNNHEGNLSFITNEPSNFRCLTLSLTVIGAVKLPSGKYAIFSTDDFLSEVGVFNDLDCTYERIIRSSCLNFNKANLIKGVAKENFDCTESIYFTDGSNPRRVLNLSNVPYKFNQLDDECKTKVFTNELDCDELLIDKKISYPKITVEPGTDGVLKNGSYQVALAYTVNGQVATDWMGVTFPVKFFDHAPAGRSLEVSIENLDKEFDEYALSVIYNVDGSVAVDKIGVYSTAQEKVVVTNVGRTAINNTLLTLDEIVIKRPVYNTAEDVVATSQHLLWTNPGTKQELDYQSKAMNITAKWVAYKVPKDYYRTGGALVGYMRDEVYTFGIQWLYSTGDWSPAYHIPGRLPKGNEDRQVSGLDVYEKSDTTCEDEDLPFLFQVNNTAKLTKRYPNPTVFCDPTLVAEGTMAYWQSSEKYPDNEVLYGDSKCTPIRHHKFPDSETIHIHDNEVGVDSGVIIIGARFENIEKPADSNIVGYRIVRGDRLGNRSVVAKGLLFNTANYEDNGVPSMYPNYPYNDLRNDPFLSSTQTKFGSSESNFNSIGDYNFDKYTFHSPSTAFNKPILGSELKVEVEEIAKVTGKFDEVHRHPKYKFITNFAFGIAAVIGAGSAYMAIRGRKCVTAGTSPGGADGAPRPFNYNVECETELTGKVGVPGGIVPIPNFVGIAIAYGYYFALGLQTVLNLVKLLSNWHQFAYQYNSQGFYSGYDYVRRGNKRRRINYAQYLIPGAQEINGVRMNNFNRESSVYLELSSGLDTPRNRDTSRNTISGFGLCNNPTQTVFSQATSYYASIKKKVPNQYGQLSGISYLDTGVVQDMGDTEFLFSSDIFGGDTYISRFTEKRKMTYFLQWPFDVPDGYEWDYRRYANIPYPRFWIDGTEYDFGDMARLNAPSSKHNLDCYRAGRGLFIVKDRYFYLFNNGVIDYYAESEYNPDYRDWEDTIEGRHYDWHSYTNLKEMFRSDKIQFDNRFIFDKVYLKQLNENFIAKQGSSFDPNSKCFVQYDNRIIYSLPAQKEQIRDNWLIYPGLNYFDFGKENGHLTTVKSFGRDRLLFLFDRASPYVTLGVDTLETDQGTKVTLGDGGLFAQRPQRLLETEYGYGRSESKFAWSMTQFGGFYTSQSQGRVFMFNGESIQDITENGMHWWFQQHLPSKLLKDYPEFIHKDNPVKGVGLMSAFDSSNKVYYLTKKDYQVKEEWKDVTTYDPITDKWKVREKIPVDFGDPLIFEDASWTISYDPKLGSWVSFHDWHPQFLIQTSNHFISLNDFSFWKHNELCDSYCNFYGDDYPWEVELSYNNGQQTSTLASIEYNLECFEYKSNCADKFHLLDFNFDEMTVYNTEQTSGLIKLFQRPKRTMISPFPIFDSNHVKSEYKKKEQKYRVDQFFDLTKDRGEFSGAKLELFNLQPNGYRKVPNKVAIDYGKASRKRFRHNYGSVILRRTISDNVSMKLKLLNTKEITSTR